MPGSSLAGLLAQLASLLRRFIDWLFGGRAQRPLQVAPYGVLVAGGTNDSASTNQNIYATAEVYDPVTGSFGPTAGSMTVPRHLHAAIGLPGGKVLLTGGRSKSGLNVAEVASAELFDPSTKRFTATGSMAVPRDAHAIAFAAGGALVTGGRDPGIASAETYDAATGSFSATGSLTVGRSLHTATPIRSRGSVLVWGGASAASGGGEVYAGGGFSATGANDSVRRHCAVALRDGRVLVAGGVSTVDGSTASDAAIFDPRTWQLTACGSLNRARSDFTATLLADGRVLVAGGKSHGNDNYRALDDIEIFDPATRAFTLNPNGRLRAKRFRHTATALADGRVLIVGGGNDTEPALGSAELYDPATGQCNYTGSMASARVEHTATPLRV
jgi:hypothetical protein